MEVSWVEVWCRTRDATSCSWARLGSPPSPLTAHRSRLTAYLYRMSLPLQHPVIRGNGRGRHAPAPDVGWRERLQALRHLPKLLRMVWETEPRYVVGILLLRVLRSAVPLAVLWIGKLIVDEVVHAIATAHAGGPMSWGRLATLVGIELAIALVGEGLSRL